MSLSNCRGLSEYIASFFCFTIGHFSAPARCATSAPGRAFRPSRTGGAAERLRAQHPREAMKPNADSAP
jgi:hypothetical protein